jgi:uncharacterized membrane protein
MIPKGRLDALTDGIYAFAMTLLVLDLSLPDNFSPGGAADLISALAAQSDHYFAYVVSFAVLALFWLGQAGIRGGHEEAAPGYARWVALHLFFVATMPFATMVVGEFVELAPAVWLYAANMIALSGTAWRLAVLARAEGRVQWVGSINLGSAVVLAAALLSVGLSFVAAPWAMAAYLLTLADPLARRLRRRPATT